MRSMFTILSLSVVAFAGAGCGAFNGRQANPDALIGRITHNGQPMKSVTLMATGSDGTPVGGTTNDEGVYTIPNPPKGNLQFQLVSPGSGKPVFPTKYTKPNNGLGCQYTGGRQTYDMDLKP